MTIDTGDTAWMLASSALVLLMTPGLALFYGGMVRVKSVLNMIMMSFSAMGLVTVLWVLYGYSLAFAPDQGSGLIGGWDHLGLQATLTVPFGTIPTTVFIAFQLMFAIITVALISGALADRAKFAGWLVFAGLWVSLVYFPVAHWVFFFGDADTTDDGGLIADRIGALDFAGGTAVHINAGAAALAAVLVLGKRVGWPKEAFKPHNLTLVMLGAGLLWFGWFGFNAGSAVASNALAGVAFLNTVVAPAAAMLAWLLVEKIRDGKATTLGAASGVVAGLVAITPAAGSVNPAGAIAIGVVAGALCAVAVGLKYKLGFDDSLDVVGLHLVGGVVGSLMIGLFAKPSVTGILTPEAGDGAAGLFFGGGFELLGDQALAVLIVAVYSFVVSWILAKIVDLTIGFRITTDDEVTGVDTTTHAESAYDYAGLAGGSGSATSPARVPAPAGAGKKG